MKAQRPRDQKHKPVIASATNSIRLGVAAIVLLTVVAYIPAMSAGFIWDDDAYVTDNVLLRDLNGLRRIWIPRETPQYYPVVFTMFWAEYQMWKDSPAGYHLINILLHVVNALLVWRLCRVIKIPGGDTASWLVAAVFALHPVHVESVAWITERKNVLSGFFYLSAMLTYLRFDVTRPPAEPGANGFRRWRPYALSLALFVLALLSKSVTCSLPAALVLIMLYQRKPLNIKRLALLLPLFAIGLALALHTAQLEREHVGAEGERFLFSIAERIIIASQALLFYPMKLVLPWPLVFIYPRWDLNPSSIVSHWAAAVVLVIAVTAIIGFVRGRRGPALALAFYAGTIFPALGFFNVYPMLFSFVADHFQYLASLGVIVLLVGAASTMFGGGWRLLAGASVPLIAFLMLTVIQTTIYRTPETLWTHTLSWNEPSWMPHGNLSKNLLTRGFALRAAGHTQDANELITRGFSHLARAMELNPGLQADVIETDWMMHALLGAHFQRRGDLDRSIEHYRLFLSRQPGDVDVQVQLASVLAARASQHANAGLYEQAVQLATEAQQTYATYGRHDLANRVASRLEAYRAGRSQ